MTAFGLNAPSSSASATNACGVERDAELLVERAGERRVEERAAAQLELEVAAVAADRERAQQHGRAEVLAVVTPRGDADAEVHGVDAAGGRELEALRGDPVGGDLGAAQGEVVADEAARAGSILPVMNWARPPGCVVAELDARARRVDEVQQRRDAAEAAPAPPARTCARGRRRCRSTSPRLRHGWRAAGSPDAPDVPGGRVHRAHRPFCSLATQGHDRAAHVAFRGAPGGFANHQPVVEGTLQP